MFCFQVAAERLANLSKAVMSYKERRRKVDYTKKYTDNNTITAVRAMNDYLLKSRYIIGSEY